MDIIWNWIALTIVIAIFLYYYLGVKARLVREKSKEINNKIIEEENLSRLDKFVGNTQCQAMGGQWYSNKHGWGCHFNRPDCPQGCKLGTCNNAKNCKNYPICCKFDHDCMTCKEVPSEEDITQTESEATKIIPDSRTPEQAKCRDEFKMKQCRCIKQNIGNQNFCGFIEGAFSYGCDPGCCEEDCLTTNIGIKSNEADVVNPIPEELETKRHNRDISNNFGNEPFSNSRVMELSPSAPIRQMSKQKSDQRSDSENYEKVAEFKSGTSLNISEINPSLTESVVKATVLTDDAEIRRQVQQMILLAEDGIASDPRELDPDYYQYYYCFRTDNNPKSTLRDKCERKRGRELCGLNPKTGKFKPVYLTRKECHYDNIKCNKLNQKNCLKTIGCGWCIDDNYKGSCIRGFPHGPVDPKSRCRIKDGSTKNSYVYGISRYLV